MTADEYYLTIEAVKHWNNQHLCNLITLYCRTVGLLPFDENSETVKPMLSDKILLDNALKNSREKSLPELPKLVNKVNKMRENLLNTVIGQEHAVHSFCEEIFNAEIFFAGDKNRKRPQAIYLHLQDRPVSAKLFLRNRQLNILGFRIKDSICPTIPDTTHTRD